MTIFLALLAAVGVGSTIGALKLFVNQETEHVGTRCIARASADVQAYVESQTIQFKEDVKLRKPSSHKSRSR